MLARNYRLSRMSEQLLRARDVAFRLGISERQFYRIRLHLLAAGLQLVAIPGTASEQSHRYRESSLDRLIKRAAERGETLC